MNNRYRSTLLSCTTCTTRAMGIILNIIGQSEVYHMSEVIHIKASCCYVCCHKQLGKMLAELLHRKVSLGLREVSMQRLCIISVLDKLICNLLGLNLCATEDDSKNTRIVVDNTLKCQILVLRIHHIIDMVHVLSTFITATNNNLLIVMQIFLCYLLYLTTHRGREHQSAMVLIDRLKNLADIL